MKKRDVQFSRFLFVAILASFLYSCSKLQKAKDVFTNPSAREVYAREFEEGSTAFSNWKEAFENATLDSVAVNLPYSETGKFNPDIFPVYSYEIALNQGERLNVSVEIDSVKSLVFLDLLRKENDTLLEPIKTAKIDSKAIQQEIEQSGIYKVVVQPEIAADTPFRLKIKAEPVYQFPVASRGNSAVQSFWGAERDGGRRSHEGIDIFAKRGTPVVAATSGRISSTGNKGLGGKQVWLRDSKRNNSLYYAHLDSIIAQPGQQVNTGDTLGLVGNSGNARTTAPHLHFGIYKGYRGAQNPLPYVYQPEEVSEIAFPEGPESELIVSTGTANLRKGPSTKSEIAGKVEPRDTLKLLGKTFNWFHARLDDQNIFIHESLARPL